VIDAKRPYRTMPGVDSFVARIAHLISHCFEAVTAAMFAVVFTAFIYKIVMRYAAGDAVAWADEISVVLFVWIVFLANGFVLDDRRQIIFDLIHRNLPPRAQRMVEFARALLVGGIIIYALPGAIDYTLFLWRERTPVLRWRLDIVYACFVMFLVAVVVREVWELFRLGRDMWGGHRFAHPGYRADRT
jgi:TRAP-type C4-dicarboxylate transport system permease small subunit